MFGLQAGSETGVLWLPRPDRAETRTASPASARPRCGQHPLGVGQGGQRVPRASDFGKEAGRHKSDSH